MIGNYKRLLQRKDLWHIIAVLLLENKSFPFTVNSLCIFPREEENRERLAHLVNGKVERKGIINIKALCFIGSVYSCSQQKIIF
jgi:hypothetical protein